MGIPLLALLIVGGIAAYFFFPRNAQASTMNSTDDTVLTMDQLFQKYGNEYGVDWKLAKAIAMQESSLNPNAVNTSDNESLGLMQVLCRPDGNGGCQNKFNVEGWGEATREKLLTPDFNIHIGLQILAWNIQQYGLPKGIAVYNNWSARTAPQEGPFSNQIYVDRVLNFYRSI